MPSYYRAIENMINVSERKNDLFQIIVSNQIVSSLHFDIKSEYVKYEMIKDMRFADFVPILETNICFKKL